MTKPEAFAALADHDRAFLRAVADTFGKPDAITICFADGGRYDGGKFRNAQDYDDFRPRSELLHQRWLEETRRCATTW